MIKTIVLFILIINTYCFSLEVVSKELFSIKNVLLPRSICVTNENLILVIDKKASDIKIFDLKGNPIKTLGRKGPGPGEFIQPLCMAYQFPYLVVYDWGKRQIIIFKHPGNSDFDYIKQILCTPMAFDIVLSGDRAIICGLTNNKKGGDYGVFELNLKTNKKKGIIPIERLYNLDSYKKYTNLNQDLASIGSAGFIAFCNQFLYSICETDLVISRTGNDKITPFGGKTKNYKKPQVTARLIKAYNEWNGREYDNEIMKFSRIVGIFANDDFIGVLYGNHSKEFSRWEFFLQLYDGQDTRFLKELKLPGAVDEGDTLPYHTFYFCRDKNLLYYISREFPGEQEIYKIHQYQIKK